jgi:hypothetical protein
MLNLIAPIAAQPAEERAREDECIRHLAEQYEDRRMVKRFQQGSETPLDKIHRQIEETYHYHVYLDELLSGCSHPPTADEQMNAEANARTLANHDDWRKYRKPRRRPGPPKPVRLVGAYGTFASALLHSSQSSGRLKAVMAGCTIPETPRPDVLADEPTELMPATREREKFLL